MTETDKKEEKEEFSVEKNTEIKLEKIVRGSGGLFFQKLDLSGKQITSLEGYQNFCFIQDLNIQHNKLTSLEPLAHMNCLFFLNASKNEISTFLDFKPLGSCSTLRFCDFSDNQITTLSENLNFFLNIRKLNLHGNKLKKLENINNLVNLKECNLSNNQLEDCSGLEELKIEKLYLQNNKIKEFKGINPDYLQVLDLNNNFITSLDKFSTLKNVIELNIANNKISSIEDFKNLKDLMFLRKLDIIGNEINLEMDKIRKTILFYIPQITFLDQQKISAKEKVVSANHFGEDKNKRLEILKSVFGTTEHEKI